MFFDDRLMINLVFAELFPEYVYFVRCRQVILTQDRLLPGELELLDGKGQDMIRQVHALAHEDQPFVLKFANFVFVSF